MTRKPVPPRRWAPALVTVVALALTAGCAAADATTSTAADTQPTPEATGSADTKPADTEPADTEPADIEPADTEPADAEPVDTGVFDSTRLHTIEVSFDEAEYDALLATYAETGDKEWMDVTVAIDGTTYEHAGMRLKGNSSLRGLTDGRSTSSSDAPETLPWLIRLDRNVDGQTHDGVVDIVIRSNNSETALNEAVALALLEQAGLASQQAAPASVSMNGSESVLRLIVEHPDDDAWQDGSFDDDGALYKAESTGDWSYRGDDPDAYTEVFDQEGGKSVADLTPLIGFLDFINNSDDAEFAAELPNRLDVDAFATYLAMMDLIENTDDIDGPGNNSYLWWDAATERFTIVPWDMNLALGGFGPGPGGAGGFPGGGDRPDRGLPEIPEGGFPEGGFPGGEPPEGWIPEGGFPGGERPSGFPGQRSNPLVERFHATTEFEELYQQRLVDLRAELFDSGTAEEILDEWVTTLETQAADLVDESTITDEADAIRRTLA